VLGPATVVGDRFVIEAVIGKGGMGEVYRATDRRTGGPVALKVVAGEGLGHDRFARFAAEVEALSQLAHPTIVSYVAHGAADDGSPWLAMELLEGESLNARLERGSLEVAEALAVTERIATALDEAHRRGILHRDLKPSNVFLRGGAPELATVLDFGIARHLGREGSLTRTGVLIGTADYMAPERARGEREIGPAVDVFALGCVLYECLTGAPPFASDDVLGTLSKILWDEAPPIEERRPDVPADLGALVGRMLIKPAAERLRDGRAVLDALADLGRSARSGAGSVRPAEAGIGRGELERVSVILASLPRAEGSAATVDASSLFDPRRREAIARDLAMRGMPVEVEMLADGSMVATVGPHGESAVDQAAVAVACARIVRALWPEAVVAVATARRVAGKRMPIGEAVERAASLLPHVHGGPVSGVVLDEVTAGLIGGRVRTVESDDGPVSLVDDGTPPDETRPLLGRPTPCVGREQELGTLEMALAASLDEGTARAVLVTGPPGIGKSRLRHELLHRAVERRSGPPPMRLEGQGDPMRVASPYGMAGQALRTLFGVAAEDGEEAAQAKVLAAVAAHAPPEGVREVAELLGELCDVPFPEHDSVRLRAAHQDPRLLQTWMGDAFVSLLRAATATAGVLVLLEDVQWADRASLELVELALRSLEDRPLFVAGFARPEVHDLHPKLWKGRSLELPLRPLGRRACVQLVERVAGDRLGAEAVARVVEQCAGNALFLEELVRFACEGTTGTVPETILAILQTRVGRLEPAERRVLRAASVLGEHFDLGGVCAVLGSSVRASDVERWLSELVRHELLAPEPAVAPGAYRFRHALMCEAVAGLVPERDLRLGHRLAAEWLEAREHDPAPVAEHYWLAGERERALPRFVAAAQRAHDRDDFVATECMVQRARECGATGETLGVLESLTSMVEMMAWRWEAGRQSTERALALLPAGSISWWRALRTRGTVAGYGDDLATLRDCVERVLSVPAPPETRLVHGDALLFLASTCTQTGLTRLAADLLRRADEVLGELLPLYPATGAWLNVVRCSYLRHTDDLLARQIELLRQSLALYEEAGVQTGTAVLARDVLGEVLCRAGAIDEGEATLRAARDAAVRLHTGYFVSHTTLALANGLVVRAEPHLRDEAARLARSLLETPRISAGYQAMAHDVLAQVATRNADFATAEAEARAAVALSMHTPVRRWLMTAHLADALTYASRAGEAWEVGAAALAELDEAGGGGYAELALVEACGRAARAAGHGARAEELEARGQAWVARQARALEGDARRRFLDWVTSLRSSAA